MRKISTFPRPLFVFALSILSYLFYFAGVTPGYYSVDVLHHLDAFSLFSDWSGWFQQCVPSRFEHSFFYRGYILIFYLITKNLVALGFFQVLLVSAINTYCWDVLKKFSNTKIAWIVTLLMIFSPINGIMTAWYHRSSLFGWLVGLNLILLYKFSKIHRFERLEKIIFLANLLLVSFLRIDGIIISLSSLVIFLLKIRDRKRIKIGVLAGFVLIVVIYVLYPVYRFPNPSPSRFSVALLPIYVVRGIHQSANLEFKEEDIKVLNPLFHSESDRKIWFEGDEFSAPIRDDVNQNELKKFLKWSIYFMIKNFHYLIKTQTVLFLDSSRPYYFYADDAYKNEEYFIELKERIGVSDGQGNNKIHHEISVFIFSSASTLHMIFVALMFGTFIPFVFIFIYFAVALNHDKNVLTPLFPLFLYSIYLFLIQPVAVSYYWYWLSYSYYFLVLGLFPRSKIKT